MSWEALGDWWVEELHTDPAYDEEIAPQLLELLAPKVGGRYLDLGCGQGRIMEQVVAAGAAVIGCDLNRGLLRRVPHGLPVVQAVLPEMSWIRAASFDGAYVGLVLEHVADEASLFAGAARAVRTGGTLAMVINHPIWTAPKSSPIELEDEVLWRPGRYFGRGHSDEPAGHQKVRFYHRTMSALVNAASAAGWDLQEMRESGITPASIARFPDYSGQEQIPRLLGLRWIRRPN